MRNGFKEYKFVYSPQDHDLQELVMFWQIKELDVCLEKNGNIEKFYSNFFASVPIHAVKFSLRLDLKTSVLFLATRLADKIVSFSSRRGKFNFL